MRDRPQTLQRVQHAHSFTHTLPEAGCSEQGFCADGSYYIDNSHWLNAAKIRQHLNWNDRSVETTPFISMFDNTGHSRARAQLLRDNGFQGVYIATIDTSGLQQDTIQITFSNAVVVLPVWVDTVTGTTFMSMEDIGPLLHIDFRLVQRSEWLALDSIPAKMVLRTERIN